MPYKALILDLDGTLVESLPGIKSSANLAFTEKGFPQRNTQEIRSFIGDGSWVFFKRALPNEPDSIISEVEACFKKHYPVEWKAGTSIFDGILPLLKKCKESDIKLTILSNKPHPFTEEIVSALFADIEFEIVMGQTDSIEKKPAPDGTNLIIDQLGLTKEDVLFIGDSTVDITTAHNAGIDCAAVTWGYEETDQIHALNPKYIANTVEELSPIIF